MTDSNTMYKYEIEFIADNISPFGLIEKAVKKFVSSNILNVKIIRTQINPVYGYVDEEMKHGGMIGAEEGEVVVYPDDFIVWTDEAEKS